MKRFASSTFIVTAVAVVVLFSATPSQAGIKNQEGGTSCIDSFDPEVACFGDAFLPNPATANDPVCQQRSNACTVNCVNQEMVGLTQCDRIQDPVANANCVAIVETTVQACLGQCPSCP